MQKEDKVAFAVLLIITAGAITFLLWAIKFVGEALFGWFEISAVGLDIKDALLYGTGVSAVLISLFTIIAGDGLLGELPTLLVGFFTLNIFFTLSIMWIF